MMKQFLMLVFSTVFLTSAQAQISETSDLFIELKTQDSIFFERGFNQCDLNYLKTHIADDLKFYHDKGGYQDAQLFMQNTRDNICVTSGKKPIRKLKDGSLMVYPLYDNGELYGAIQSGVHYFYIRESGKEDLRTGIAKFTSVWVLEDKLWKLSTVLSYDHAGLAQEGEK